MSKPSKITGATTALERAVQRWANSYSDHPADALRDVCHHGCQSGVVTHLIYYADTIRFYKRHRKEINQLLSDALASAGYSSPSEIFGGIWDAEDPLAHDIHNQNLLAWFGFEEAAFILADRNGIEI